MEPDMTEIDLPNYSEKDKMIEEESLEPYMERYIEKDLISKVRRETIRGFIVK